MKQQKTEPALTEKEIEFLKKEIYPFFEEGLKSGLSVNDAVIYAFNRHKELCVEMINAETGRSKEKIFEMSEMVYEKLSKKTR